MGFGNVGMGLQGMEVWRNQSMGFGNVGMGLTEVAPPDPGHISLTCGVGFVEVARGTRGLVHRRMRLCGVSVNVRV